MCQVPSKVVLVSGVGFGHSPLTAFDSALLDAGIGNYNLVRVSSIVPPGAEVIVADGMTFSTDVRPGCLLPVVYTHSVSAKDGGQVASCIGVGIPEERGEVGVIFEASVNTTADEAQQLVTEMIVEAFQSRGLKIGNMIFTKMEAVVLCPYTCVVSAAVLLP